MHLLKKIAKLVWLVVGGAIGTVLGLMLVGGILWCLFLMFLCAPISLVFETVDVVQMRGTTTGQITNVEMKHGRLGTSRANVRYQFQVQGRQFESEKVFTGFFGNWGTNTGGGNLARQYPVGKQVEVHFVPQSPERCALERGWYHWSVGFSCAIWGIVLSGLAESRCPMLRPFFNACMLYGLGVILCCQFTVRTMDLPWHLAAFLAMVALSFGYSLLFPWRRQPKDGLPSKMETAVT